MWVIPVVKLDAILSTGNLLPPHEDVKESMVQWKSGMKTLFFSHTWLGYSHPDPNGDKMKLLAAILKGILSGKCKFQGYWMATIIFGETGIPAKRLTKDFASGYVWLDYLSIPQRDKTNQGLAIQSITSYVALSDLFVVLAGPWQHADDGSIRDVRAWGERGWCRMENLASALSPVQKKFVVAQSPTDILAYGPLGIVGRFWFQNTVGRGTFTVDADRLSLGPSIRTLIERRQRQAVRESDWPLHRFLVAIANTLLHGTGVSLEDEPLDQWLKTMRFDGPKDGEGRKGSGLTPLRFAIVANRADLVRALLDAGADVHARVRSKVSGEFFLPGDNLLHTASTYTGHDNADIIQLLLAAGANTRSVQSNPPYGNALLNAAVCSNTFAVDALHAADSTLWQVPHLAGILPFEEAIMVGRPEMTRHMLEHYSEQLKGLPAGAPRFLNMDGRKGMQPARTAEYIERTRGMSHVVYAVMHIGDCRVLRMILEAGFDPNGAADSDLLEFKRAAKLPLRTLINVSAFASSRHPSPMSLFDRFSCFYARPLHVASIAGNLGAVALLLEFKADPSNHEPVLGRTPLHLAALKGHDSCVELLLKHAPQGINLASLKDKRGRTPRKCAARRGYPELAALLQRAEKAESAPALDDIGVSGATVADDTVMPFQAPDKMAAAKTGAFSMGSVGSLNVGASDKYLVAQDME